MCMIIACFILIMTTVQYNYITMIVSLSVYSSRHSSWLLMISWINLRQGEDSHVGISRYHHLLVSSVYFVQFKKKILFSCLTITSARVHILLC